MALSHGLLVGNRHATIRTPQPPSLASRLWAAIQPLTSQLFLDQASRLARIVSKSATRVAPNGRTRSHPRTQEPTPGGSRPTGSAGREPLFSSILRIGALDPTLGSLPTHPQPSECCSAGLATDPPVG